jgi:hypothetical protein
MNKKLNGGCLCGAVEYTVIDEFKAFYQCHCKQCQQMTGSAFASNIFTHPENIEWIKGTQNISTFDHPSREFSKAFCKTCGSALPFINQRKTSLIIPVGSLNDKPNLKPQANIFVSEEAHWLNVGLEAKKYDGFPK